MILVDKTASYKTHKLLWSHKRLCIQSKFSHIYVYVLCISTKHNWTDGFGDICTLCCIMTFKDRNTMEVCIGCVSVSVFNLHAILPCDGESVVWVVHKGHVDSNQGRTICSEHLPSDNGHQAAKNTHTWLVRNPHTHTINMIYSMTEHGFLKL